MADQADQSEQGRYVLDQQVGFLMRIAMQRHTSIFTSRMVAGLTQTQSPHLPNFMRLALARRIILAG